MPALPLHEAGKYVAAAYVVVFALVLIYVAIMAVRLGRVERDLVELLERDEEAPTPATQTRAAQTPGGSAGGGVGDGDGDAGGSVGDGGVDDGGGAAGTPELARPGSRPA